MSVNRLPKEEPEPAEGEETRVVATPFGIMTIHLSFPVDPSQPDPLGVAIAMFQGLVDEGHDDPLTATLSRLKEMAEAGTEQPLLAGLALLQKMSSVGALPPLAALLAGSSVTDGDVRRAVGKPGGDAQPARRKSLLERLDEEI